MKNGRYMTVRILLTIVLTFCMMGYLVCSAVNAIAGDAAVCTEIIQEEKLGEKVYTALEKDFKEAYNTTGIPSEVYMDAISTEWLEEEMCANVKVSFDYMNTSEKHEMIYDTDFTALEESITGFFYEYAESIDYEPDDVFEEKLSETMVNAEKKVAQRMDAFHMQTLYENGILTKVQTYLPYLNGLTWGLWAVCIGLIVILVMLERNSGWRRVYWTGSGLFCAGALLLAPCAYVLGTDAIAGFAVKDPIVYTAITNLLGDSIFRLMCKAILFGTVGLLFVIAAVVLNKKQKKAE